MNAPLKTFVCSVLLSVLGLSQLPAQSPAAAELNTRAYNLFAEGNYKEAAADYEKLLKDYPTDAIVGVAQIQLAFTYFFLGRFDESLAMLAKANAGPPLPPELKQIADALQPQILSAKAAALPESDPKRKTGFQEAIAKFTEFITKYPQAEDLETMIYSRAVANYQIGNYDETIKDAELNIQRFPQSSTLPTTKNLLAIALATKGSLELSKNGDKGRAFADYDRAANLLREIIADRRDIALYNEANFQLAEILFNQAGFSDEDKRPAFYEEALQAYRNIAPKEEIMRFQEERISAFPERRRQALQQRNQNLLKQLERENLRELTKLEEIRNRQDQTATAALKMAEIFFQKGDFNAARTLLKHVVPFLTSEEDKKRALYFTTMTYALQGASEQAVAGYNEFQSKHKGAPLAENLPVTLGTMFLSQNKPEDAIRYFDESLAIYPKGRFAGLSVVSKASAESRLGRQESAAKTFQDFLSKNPPPEIGVIAQLGLGNIYKDTGKWAEAKAAYQEVTSKYPGTPQAVEAEYWIGITTQQLGDHAGAVPLLDAFVKNHGDTPFAPLALYAKGGAQLASNDRAGGLATLAEVAERFPDSQPAPFTFFMRAQFAAQEGKGDEVVALMNQFIEKYPKDDKVFSAYDTVAQSLLQAGKTEEAMAKYTEFASQYEGNPRAAEALQKLAELQRTSAESLGRFGALSEEERAKWKTAVEASVASTENLLKSYPDSPQAALALRTLLQNQRLLAGAELKTPAEVEAYFESLAGSAASPKAKSKVLFAKADFVKDTDPDKALGIMVSAYNDQVVYAPADLDTYGTALLDNKKVDQAAQVFDKLMADYPIPAGTSPTQAAPLVQEAQAIALFGRGRVAQEKGDTAEAGKFFEQLKQLYPWSPKVAEANFGIAESLRGQGKVDEALALLGPLIQARNATAELRANSMLLFGYVMLDKSKAQTDPAEQEKFRLAAIDSFIKIAQFYAGVPQAAAEGLWMGSQLLEEQAATTKDNKPKTQHLQRAKAFYEQLLKDYPSSSFAAKARERVAALN